MRKKGRRAEELVGIIEGNLRGWLKGEGWDLRGEKEGIEWTVIDGTPVEKAAVEEEEPSTSPITSRRMPERHQLRDQLPPIPLENGQGRAILELSRSPAHLTWAIAEGFERLVTHLVVRYYELVSWSASIYSSRKVSC